MNLLKENVAHKNSEQNEPLAIDVQDVSAIIGRFFLTDISFKVPVERFVDLSGKIVLAKRYFYEHSSIR